MKLFLPFLITFTFSLSLFGQSEHFSDYTMSGLLINPATTGALPSDDASSRLTINTRNQWSSFLGKDAFRTLAASFEHRLCDGQNAGFFSFGAHAIADWQGEPALKKNTVMGSFSYTLPLNKKNILSLGIEAGGIFYATDLGDFTFDEQIGNPNALPERFGRDQFSFLDLGVGVNFSNERFFMSAALKHINRQEAGFWGNLAPAITSSDSTALLPRRLNLLAGTTLGTQSNPLEITAAFYLQVPHNQFVARALMGIDKPRESASKQTYFALGIGYRINNGAMGIGSESLLGVFQVRSLRSIYSVNLDLTTSSLIESTNGFGAIELSATFLLGKETQCVYCPTF